jgi:hypothetical protein
VRNHFDQLGKQIGKEALGSCGSTVAQYEISPETQYSDLCYEPDPAHLAERMRLGLLGKMANVPSLIEIYARAPTAEDFRACLSKHLAYWRQRARKHEKQAEEAKRLGKPAEAFVEPHLLMVAARSPTGLRSKLRLVRASGCPKVHPHGSEPFGAQSGRSQIDGAARRQPRGVTQAVEDVAELQLGILLDDLLRGLLRSKVPEHQRHRNAKAANARLSSTNARVSRDARERNDHPAKLALAASAGNVFHSGKDKPVASVHLLFAQFLGLLLDKSHFLGTEVLLEGPHDHWKGLLDGAGHLVGELDPNAFFRSGRDRAIG